MSESRRSPDDLVLTVDLGSSALKLGVATLAGELLAVEQRPLDTVRETEGAAVQDAAAWWESVLELGRSALSDVDAGRVVAVSCTSQWASIVPVDESGEPLAPCVMWLDTRGAPHSRGAVGGPLMGYSPRALATWIRRTAGIPSPHGGDTVSHILQIERDRPELASRVRWYLEPVDYLTMRLTGRASATHASMIGAWLTDNRSLDRLSYDPVLLRRAGIDDEKLAPLVPIGTVLGELAAKPAAALGLGPGVEVVTGIPDLHSAAFGAGAASLGEAHMPIGTTSWISLPFARKKTDVLRSIASVPGLDQSSYLVVNNHEAAGLALRWARDALAAGEPQPWDELFGAAEAAPAGSGGVIFTPWIAGERSPVDDRLARGGWHNLSVETAHGDLVRAVLEGVAYNSRWLGEAVERFTGERLDDLRIFGGGAASDLWCQIHADVMDRTIERVADPLHTNLRGAALFCAVSLGAIERSQVRDLVPVDRRFQPDPANRGAYDRLYAEFPGLYKAQRKMFARLNAAGSGGGGSDSPPRG